MQHFRKIFSARQKAAGTLLMLALTLPRFLTAANVEVSWQPNSEDDLMGYRIYYGTASGSYSSSLDVGNVTGFTVTGLDEDATYYFAVTAYDQSGNESVYSEEKDYTTYDETPPTIVEVRVPEDDMVVVTFSEEVDETSAEIISNYSINNGIQITQALLRTDGKTVQLTTNSHANGNYTLTISNVLDNASVNNEIAENSKAYYSYSGNDDTAPTVTNVQVFRNHAGDFVGLTFSEPLDQTTALTQSNYSISGGVAINSVIPGDSQEKVFLSTQSHTPGQSYTLTMNNLKDGDGNTIAANTRTTYQVVSEDTDPPRLIAARLNNANRLEIEFSETVTASSAENVSNYSLTPSLSIQNASLNAGGTIVTLSTGTHAQGNYTINVSNVTDDANPPNAMVTEQLIYNYTAPDNVAPQLLSAAIQSDDLVLLTFSEALDAASAEQVSNYSISPSVSIVSAVLNVSQVQVLLQTSSHSAGDYQVRVQGVKDQAGTPNTIASGSTASYTFAPPDFTAPEIQQALLHGANVVELIFSEGLDRISAETAANYAISPSVGITNASLVGDNLDRVYLLTNNHQPGQSYTITINGIKDRALNPNTIANNATVNYSYQSVDTAPPRLVNASLQGLRFVELEFNEPLDNATAGNINNYAITPSLTVESATLDASAKKIFLKTSAHVPGTTYHVTVQNVQDLANPANKIQNENGKTYICESQDVTAPIFRRADLHAGGTTLELWFSEPLDPAAALNVNNYQIDKNITVQRATLSNSQTEVFLQTSQHQRGAYTIQVNNLKDLATIPNTVEANSSLMYSYTPADTSAPVIISTQLLSSTMLEINFSEPLDQSTVSNPANYTISNGVVINRVILDVTMQRVILQTAEHIPGNYSVTINGVKDGFDNQIRANTVAAYDYVTEDHTPPTIAGVDPYSDRMLVVTFSEVMNKESVLNKENYVINNNIQINQIYQASGNDQVVLETSCHAAGDYVLTVNNLKDASIHENPIAAYSQIAYSWTPNDSTAPRITHAQLQHNSLLELTFSEAVDAVESVKVSNYSISPKVNIQSAVLDASLTKVWLYTDAHEMGMYRISAVNIKDRAFTPNTINTQNEAVYVYAPPDTASPEIESITLRTSMSLALNFNEAVTRETAENPANYTITPKVDVTQVYLLANLRTVHLETAPHQPKVSYTIQVRNIEDRAPVANCMDAPVQMGYHFSPPDTVAPKLLSSKLHGANTLELVFSEPVDQQSAETRGNYAIDPSVEVLNAAIDTARLDRVFLETTTHMPGMSYTVYIRNIKDCATMPNMAANSSGLSYSMSSSGYGSDKASPYVARMEVMSSTEMDVIFSEPVDEETALRKSNYLIDEGVIVKSVEMDSSAVRVHITTSPHNMERAYAFNAANIKDRASNTMDGRTPVSYIMSKGVTVSQPSQADYGLDILKSEGTIYVDREYTLERYPEDLEGAIQIKTVNDDKESTGNRHLEFELQGEATIYVAYDKRITEIPEWLSAWTPTGEQIVDSRTNVYRVYSLEAGAGRVSIGGNSGTSDDNMYQVYVRPHHTKSSVIASINKPYETAYMDQEESLYIDRDYINVSQVSDSLKGLLWIKTALEDRRTDDDELLTFVLNEPSRIFVAYDSTIRTVSRWLDDWELTEFYVNDNRGSRFQVYAKDFEAGPVTMGANNAKMTEKNGIDEDMMYFVLIKSESGQYGVDGTLLPGYFELEQNYPNPFNPETNIEYRIHKTGHITLTVYNVLGQRVKVLVNDVMEAGDYGHTIWDGTDFRGNQVASGVYFYRIRQENYALSKRMILMR